MKMNRFEHCDEWLTFSCNIKEHDYFEIHSFSSYEDPDSPEENRKLFFIFDFFLHESQTIR